MKEHEVLVELTLESNNSLQFEFLFHLFVLVGECMSVKSNIVIFQSLGNLLNISKSMEIRINYSYNFEF